MGILLLAVAVGSLNLGHLVSCPVGQVDCITCMYGHSEACQYSPTSQTCEKKPGKRNKLRRNLRSLKFWKASDKLSYCPLAETVNFFGPADACIKSATGILEAYKRAEAAVKKRLSVDQNTAITLYTLPKMGDGADSCNRELFAELNAGLRRNNDLWLPFKDLLVSALLLLPMPTQTTLWRGMLGDLADVKFSGKGVSKNEVVTMDAFTSTSVSQKVATDWLKGRLGILFKFEVDATAHPGRSVKSWSALPLEEEILLMPDSMFMVTDIQKQVSFGESKPLLVTMKQTFPE